jgi:hypothetical protein
LRAIGKRGARQYISERDALQSRLEAVTQERDDARNARLKTMTDTIGQREEWMFALACSLLAVTEERDEAREVLKFYANTDTYRSAEVFMCGHRGQARIDLDLGKRARAALGETEGKR